MLTLRHQQIVERLVGGIQRLAERNLDGAAAFGARVARGETDFGEIARACLVERGGRAFDFERLRAQRQIRLQSFAHVVVDDRGQRTAAVDGRLLRVNATEPNAMLASNSDRPPNRSQVLSRWTPV